MKYLSNLVEQHHRVIKRLVWFMERKSDRSIGRMFSVTDHAASYILVSLRSQSGF